MMYLSRPRLIRRCLLLLPVLVTLAWASHSEAARSDLHAPEDSPLPVYQAGAETDVGVSSLSGPVADAGLGSANDRRDDLTGFFVIGMIINVMLIILFLIWAAGQWRKTKK